MVCALLSWNPPDPALCFGQTYTVTAACADGTSRPSVGILYYDAQGQQVGDPQTEEGMPGFSSVSWFHLIQPGQIASAKVRVQCHGQTPGENSLCDVTMELPLALCP